jgi:hypothetical protein
MRKLPWYLNVFFLLYLLGAIFSVVSCSTSGGA